MTFSAKEMIQKRKSVRTYAGRGLRPKDKSALEKYIQSVSNPFDVPVEFRLLRAKDYKLSSPVIVGEKYYIAAKLSKCKNFEIGYGYSFESMCLYAESLGLVVQVEEITEAEFEKLFFKGTFEIGLTKEDAGIFADALEMTRWAPSAANKQPWRIVVSGDTVHFYEYKTLKDSPLGDIQKVDLGIALAHFDLTMQEDGYEGHFIEADPGLELPENVHYIISYERTK